MYKIILLLSVIVMIQRFSCNPDRSRDSNTDPTTPVPFDINSGEWNKTGLVLDVPTVTPTVCGYDTPCGWGLYDRFSEVVTSYIQNRSCYCGPGTFCYRAKNDKPTASYIYLCREKDPRDNA